MYSSPSAARQNDSWRCLSLWLWQGKQTIDCFTNFSSSIGGGTLLKSARLISSGNPTLTQEDVDSFNEFLNCVRPGAAALSSLLAGREPFGLWTIETEHWGEAKEIFAAFTPKFYSPERVAVVFTLAAQTLGNAVGNFGKKIIVPMVEEQLEQVLVDLAHWAEGEGKDKDFEHLARQLITDKNNGQGIQTLADIFKRGVPPQPLNVANWILQPEAITLAAEVEVEA